jgi:hypothetical protein
MERMLFVFRLPTALLLFAPTGYWRDVPRGAELCVGPEGSVIVRSFDHHDTYARDQVVKVTQKFFRTFFKNAPATTLPALLTPHGARPEHYAITLNASVSIARTQLAPSLA